MPHESRTTLTGGGGGGGGRADLNRRSANRASKQSVEMGRVPSNEETDRYGTICHQMKDREEEEEEEEANDDDDENPNPQSSSWAKNQEQPRNQLETTAIATATATSAANNAIEESDMEEDDQSQSVPTLQEKLQKATEWTEELLQLKSQINQTRVRT